MSNNSRNETFLLQDPLLQKQFDRLLREWISSTLLSSKSATALERIVLKFKWNCEKKSLGMNSVWLYILQVDISKRIKIFAILYSSFRS